MARYNDIDVDAYNASWDQKVIGGVVQYLSAFKCCEELLDILKKYLSDIRNSRDMKAVAKMRERGKEPTPSKPCCGGENKSTVIETDGGMRFVPTVLVCPDCGSDIYQAMFCEKMLVGNPGLDASGMMVCSRHPLLGKQGVGGGCFFELYLPPRKKQVGGERER